MSDDSDRPRQSFAITRTIGLDNPNGLGEALRDEFFDQDPEAGRLGCYSTFDYAPGVVSLPTDVRVLGEDPWLGVQEWTRAHKAIDGHDVVMEYHWDGDGTLRFLLPGGAVLENTDCKKTWCWELREGD